VGRTRNPPSRRAPALDWTSEPLVRTSRAAVVVENRYCHVFKLERVRPALVADGLAGLHIYKPYVQSSSARPASSPRNGTCIGSWPPPTHGPRPRPPWIERLTPLAAAAATTELASARRTRAMRRRSPGVGARYRSCHRQNGRRDRSVPVAACAAEPTGAGGGPGTDHLRQRGRRLHHRPGCDRADRPGSADDGGAAAGRPGVAENRPLVVRRVDIDRPALASVELTADDATTIKQRDREVAARNCDLQRAVGWPGPGRAGLGEVFVPRSAR
jgi:hypothetical protein